jgi:hypothetical protein
LHDGLRVNTAFMRYGIASWRRREYGERLVPARDVRCG